MMKESEKEGGLARAADESPPKTPMGAKERFYDRIPLTARQLDIIIALLAVAFVVFLAIGVIQGNR